MQALVGLSTFWLVTLGLFTLDPMGYYHAKPSEPPTPLEQLRTEVWAANMASGLAATAETSRQFRAKYYAEIRAKAVQRGIDPKEVFQ